MICVKNCPTSQISHTRTNLSICEGIYGKCDDPHLFKGLPEGLLLGLWFELGSAKGLNRKRGRDFHYIHDMYVSVSVCVYVKNITS